MTSGFALCIICINIVNTDFKGGDDVINLNYRDSRPIYEQIKDGIRKLVMTGAFSPHERLPSVRELASSLAINPNTIQRAYKELEAEGYIYTTAGKGSFVSDISEVDAGRRERQLKKFEEAAVELMFLGMGAGELKSRIDRLAKDSEGGRAQHDTNFD